MTPRHLVHIACAVCCSCAIGAFAQSPSSDAPNAPPSSQTKKPARAGDRIYGSQLMTPEERTAYMEKMHAAKTEEERQRLRAEHHQEMQARAKDKGITLPDQMPRRQHGRGMGMGPGMQMGPGPQDGGSSTLGK